MCTYLWRSIYILALSLVIFTAAWTPVDGDSTALPQVGCGPVFGWPAKDRCAQLTEPSEDGLQALHTGILHDNAKLLFKSAPIYPLTLPAAEMGVSANAWSCQTLWVLPIWWAQGGVSLWFYLLKNNASPSNQIASCHRPQPLLTSSVF